MRKRALLSLLTALAMTASMVLTSAAAGLPKLVVSSQKAARQEVALDNLPAGCQSLQITLTLSEEGATYTYLPDGGLAPGVVYTTARQDGARVTIYITAKSGVLTQTGSLTLGTLSADEGSLFTVEGGFDLKTLDPNAAEQRFPSLEEDETVPVPDPDPVPNPGGDDKPGSGGGSSSGGSGAPSDEVEDSRPTQGQQTFDDVPADSWYAQAVSAVYEQGLMGGTGEGKFSPDVTTSRAMIVTILYAMEGKPAVSGGQSFADVLPGQWFAHPVAWASANGIVSGYGDGVFGPDDPITREQLAVILRGYAAYRGCDVTARASLDGYADAGQVSGYAVDAMGWALAQGLISGTGVHTLSPRGSATRAQAAVILNQFSKLLSRT